MVVVVVVVDGDRKEKDNIGSIVVAGEEAVGGMAGGRWVNVNAGEESEAGFRFGFTVVRLAYHIPRERKNYCNIRRKERWGDWRGEQEERICGGGGFGASEKVNERS